MPLKSSTHIEPNAFRTTNVSPPGRKVPVTLFVAGSISVTVPST